MTTKMPQVLEVGRCIHWRIHGNIRNIMRIAVDDHPFATFDVHTPSSTLCTLAICLEVNSCATTTHLQRACRTPHDLLTGKWYVADATLDSDPTPTSPVTTGLAHLPHSMVKLMNTVARVVAKTIDCSGLTTTCHPLGMASKPLLVGRRNAIATHLVVMGKNNSSFCRNYVIIQSHATTMLSQHAVCSASRPLAIWWSSAVRVPFGNRRVSIWESIVSSSILRTHRSNTF